MKKNDLKFTRILFLIIFLILVGFAVSGIYFMKSNALGAGFLGIGIAILGFGVMCLLGNGVIYQLADPVDLYGKSSRKTKTNAEIDGISDVAFHMDAVLAREGSGRGPVAGILYLSDDKLYIKNLEPDIIKVSYEKLSKVEYSKNQAVLTGEFVFGSHLKHASITVQCESIIKLKAFSQLLDMKLIAFR